MRLKKPRLKKKLTYSKAKKQAWDAFSVYIRMRDASRGCFTCDIKKPWKQMQAGHFIPGRHNSILFDERNCHAQCYQCNVPLKGNVVEYYPRMLEMYGQEVIDELKRLNKQTADLKVYQLVEIRDKYRRLVGLPVEDL